MSHFADLVATKKVALWPKPLWRLTEALVYHSDLAGLIVVPLDFVTDFASVPRAPILFLLAGGKADEAAVVHDYLYSTLRFDRRMCDKIFHEAIRAMGHSENLADAMYAAVRIGGASHYKLPNVPQTPAVQAQMDSFSAADLVAA